MLYSYPTRTLGIIRAQCVRASQQARRRRIQGRPNMLRVSTRGEYGVRLMVDLARHYGQQPRSLNEISLAEGLQLKVQYLEQLVRSLREAGLVESTRGAHGGYRLSRAP